MGKNKYVESGIKPYDIFILGLMFLSVVNIFLYIILPNNAVEFVVLTIDILLSFVFFIDFLKRLSRSENKSHYFFIEYGWADLFSSLPYPLFKIFRVFRLVRALILIKKAGGRKLLKENSKHLADGALYFIFFMIILLLEFGSMVVLVAESNDPAANIKSASDAIWWVYVTITTVGYGDVYPITNAGRLVGVLVMIIGVGLFAVVTGFLANKFLPNSNKAKNNQTNENESIGKLQTEITEIKSLVEKLSNKTK